MSRALQVNDREKTAGRLLNSSARNSYDPEVDVDWDAPLVEGKPFIPFHRSSLYGTPLWDRLSDEQRIELTKHEFASIASNGLWFEVLLMQMLLKEFYDSDPRTNHAQYALTEVADECRHSTMFAKAVDRVGAPAYGPLPLLKLGGRILPATLRGPSAYASILVAEEILDRYQRDQMNDPEVQPLVRMINRIHVLEEARHVTFAREEVVRRMAECNAAERAYHQFWTALVSYAICFSLINPHVYKAVGIRPRDGLEAAWRNPNWRDTLHWGGEKIMSFLDEAGLVGKPGMYWWKKAYLIR
ncbi:P-aminobenzoate N-oxygenase AurF [Saccharopolyspora kobensis]|uniref:p-aminobenzoate N-oxygenase AurF n=1 Tax=Saccharopolyspora kobensis TaxID=146035 RepID=A0A1H6CXQ4_9PSEU|nr:diiron oxygenase [Saccharopolyspora kobensis]SEG77548.1 P-aminobenzoate N-oxygenase AurF [Saccharopolyspora kobensis]SFD02709.1 P-aminobenzoate N-oxygenase AurF [Saccharopolyspora kobensis]